LGEKDDDQHSKDQQHIDEYKLFSQ